MNQSSYRRDLSPRLKRVGEQVEDFWRPKFSELQRSGADVDLDATAVMRRGSVEPILNHWRTALAAPRPYCLAANEYPLYLLRSELRKLGARERLAEPLIPAHRPGEDINCTFLHCGNVAMGRNKHHRQGFLRLGERLLQLQTAGSSRHLQVEHHATGGFRTVAFEEFLRRSKGFDSVIRSPEKAGQSAQKRHVVIYQIDDWRALMLALSLGWGDGFMGHADFSSLLRLVGRVKRTHLAWD